MPSFSVLWLVCSEREFETSLGKACDPWHIAGGLPNSFLVLGIINF